MGWVSTIVINNDRLADVENDTEFGKKVAQSVRKLSVVPGSVTIAHGAEAIEQHHADYTTPVLVGGHSPGEAVPVQVYYRVEDHQLEVVKMWADKLGYRLVKKTAR